MCKKLLCGYCKREFDHNKWIADECCIHCSKFLDNPPNLIEECIPQTQGGSK